jgi:hypothetical protein
MDCFHIGSAKIVKNGSHKERKAGEGFSGQTFLPAQNQNHELR